MYFAFIKNVLFLEIKICLLINKKLIINLFFKVCDCFYELYLRVEFKERDYSINLSNLI